MATVPLYDNTGKEIGTLPLPDSIFGVEFNEGLVHQAIVTEEANMRQGTHDTKGRSEVRGGGRKPWKQKGTGRARQGSIRAPHFRKGGVYGGPTPRSYRKRFPIKMRRAAMRCVLSSRVANGAIVALDALTFSEIKTKQAVALLTALGLNETRRVLVIIPEHNETIHKSTRNLPNVELRHAPNFSVRDAMIAHKIVLVKDAVAKIEAVWTPESARTAEETAPVAQAAQTEEVTA